MNEYVKIKVDDLIKINERMNEKDTYIKKLELALKSVNRQLANIEEKANAEK